MMRVCVIIGEVKSSPINASSKARAAHEFPCRLPSALVLGLVSHFRCSFEYAGSSEYNCELLWPLAMEPGSHEAHEELIPAPEAKPPPPSTDFVADDEEVRPQKYLIARAAEDACVLVLIY